MLTSYPPLFWVVPIAGAIAILFAIYLAYETLHRDTGTEDMQKIAGTIFEGAMAFLRRQYTTIGILAVVAAIVIGILLAVLSGGSDADKVSLAWHTSVAFLVGAICSGLSGFIGMYVAVKSNLRTASAARRSLNEALTVALSGGTVSGFLVVALSLLGVTSVFLLYGGLGSATQIAQAPFVIVGFAFGASFVALFAQLGGGIYTKAADVGADLVGKVEAGIPEDDPRNPAVIADLVGDNVGDCAGRGADLFESTAAENIGAMILGVAIAVSTRNVAWIIFPLVVMGFGLIASLGGIMTVRLTKVKEPSARDKDPGKLAMGGLNRGYYVTALLSVVFMFIASKYLLNDLWFFGCGLVGIVLSILVVYITQYYTAGQWRPVKEIAEACKTGPATTIISGYAVALECTAAPVLAFCGALFLSYWMGAQALHIQHNAAATIFTLDPGGIYGTAVATMGMLMSCGYVLAMDTFGPITDNAGGITEMSHSAGGARAITDALDSVGNTTKALTKGYGIGSASLAAFLLFSAFLTAAKVGGTVNLADIKVFIGCFVGAALVFLFSSLAIRAVGSAAQTIITEVRRQFRQNPGILKGTVAPSYREAVDITTRAALRQMVAPGLLAVVTPIVVGLVLRAQALAGMLLVATIAGTLMALLMNNGGGAWDNAKKYIEAGFLTDDKGKVLGKGSPAHAAGVVGDTVGDPFKDTAGPSLHVLIKLLATVSLVLAPLFIGH